MSWDSFIGRNYYKIRVLGIDLKGVNSIRFSGNESFKHRVVKFMVCHLLSMKGHRFKTEENIKGSICDVIDLDNFIIYEVESKATKRTLRKKLDDFYHPYIEDIIVIDIRKLRYDWNPILKLRDKISKMII